MSETDALLQRLADAGRCFAVEFFHPDRWKDQPRWMVTIARTATDEREPRFWGDTLPEALSASLAWAGIADTETPPA